MLHLLYSTRRPSLSLDELENAGIDCYPDTIMMLEAMDLVHNRDAQYSLVKQTAAMASNFVVALRRWPGTDCALIIHRPSSSCHSASPGPVRYISI